MKNKREDQSNNARVPAKAEIISKEDFIKFIEILRTNYEIQFSDFPDKEIQKKIYVLMGWGRIL